MPYKDRETNLAYFRNWYRRNKEKQAIYSKDYQAKNKDKLRLYTENYRKDRPWLISYMTAKQRCTNKKNHNYYRYGGRGILFQLSKNQVKELWERDKAYLLTWPTLDRVNNDGNYEFANCRFIEMSENSRRQHQ